MFLRRIFRGKLQDFSIIYVYIYTHIHRYMYIYICMRSDMILIDLEIWNINDYTTIQLSVPLPLTAKKALAAPWPRASLLCQSWWCKRFFAPDKKTTIREKMFRTDLQRMVSSANAAAVLCSFFLEAFSSLWVRFGRGKLEPKLLRWTSRMTPTPHKK